MLSSTTKGITATCMHVLVEKHKLSYDMPIVKVWPEFGQNGKDAATLRHALSHQTGVPQTPVGYTPDWLPDWDRMCRGIAALKPMYPIGQRTAYHSLNYGYINGEILRRVDGRTIAQFLQDEICKPLGINGIYLGVPDRELHRVAVLTDAPPAPADYDARMVGEPAGSFVAKVFNRREVQQASIPGSGGIMSARGLARHYAMLANWGELDGVRVLPEARVRAGIELQSFEWTRCTGYARGAPSAIDAAVTRDRWPRKRPSVTSAVAARSATPTRPADSVSASPRTTSTTPPAERSIAVNRRAPHRTSSPRLYSTHWA
jgi:CubicO group peptidase (beta-lactamase class C family)